MAEITSTTPIGVAVFGYGRMGIIHATNAYQNPKLKLYYVVARNQKKAQELASRFPGVEGIGADQLEEKVWKNKNIGAVILASATPTHHALSLEALRAGKAVFTEKPVALDKKEITECFNEASKLHLPFLCGYNRRFDPHFARMHAQLKEIGTVKFFRLTSRDHPPPPLDFLDSAGTFFDDFSTHDVDTARWITGEEPELVYAVASSFLPGYKAKNVDDTAIIVLKFPSGAICVIDNSRRTTYGYDQRIEILGTKGMLQAENPLVNSVKVWSGNGNQGAVAKYSFPERYQEAYNVELNHFVDMITTKAQPKVNHQDCLAAADLTLRCQQSRVQQFTESKHANVKDNTPASNLKGPINFCVCGIGRMGQARAAAVVKNPNSKLLYAYDVDEKRLNDFAKEYNCKPVTTLDQALADPNLHAVIIATFSPTHKELLLKCIAAKKAIFCEKPLCLSSKDTDECLDAAEKAGVMIYCGFQRRSDPEFLHAKKQVTDGVIGPVELLRITSRDAASHNSMGYLLNSGGYFYDSLIHDFDMAHWMMGQAPCEVFCIGSSFIPELKAANDIDSVVVVLRFPNGSICSIDNNRSAVYGYDQRLEAFGSNGMVQVQNYQNSAVTISTEKGFSTETTMPGMQRYAVAYEAEIDHFIDVLMGAKSRVSHTDCRIAHRIADAAIESFKTGKRVQF